MPQKLTSMPQKLPKMAKNAKILQKYHHIPHAIFMSTN